MLAQGSRSERSSSAGPSELVKRDWHISFGSPSELKAVVRNATRGSDDSPARCAEGSADRRDGATGRHLNESGEGAVEAARAVPAKE